MELIKGTFTKGRQDRYRWGGLVHFLGKVGVGQEFHFNVILMFLLVTQTRKILVISGSGGIMATKIVYLQTRFTAMKL